MHNAAPRCGAMRIVTCCCNAGARAVLCYTLRHFRTDPSLFHQTARSFVRPTLFLLVLTLAMAGCGYKGPLYLPDQKPAAKKPATKSPAPAESPQSP